MLVVVRVVGSVGTLVAYVFHNVRTDAGLEAELNDVSDSHSES